ncbi:MAG: zinc ABC transporter substrate-binding protein [Truepera sp.]|nr:zinc ABC transporter substrate-binding protein [Truepera sp.]
MVWRRFSFALAAAVLLGCAATGPAAAENGLRVVASIKPVHSLVSAVMAGVGEPYLIIRGASSPHTFTLRPSDAAALEDADIIFLIGDTMETALAGLVDALAGQTLVVALADAPGLVRRLFREGGEFEVDHEHDDGDEDHGPFDMHLWLDPINGGVMAGVIASILAEADPANAAAYEANAEALLQRLDALTEELAAYLAPARGVPFIVFHDGYRYFEDRFGLTAVGSVVVSPGRPPGVRRIFELRDKVRALGVACVFDEPQFDRRLIQTVIEGSEVRAGTVDPLGAAIEDGPGLYVTLLRNMAVSFKACLAPGDGG